MIICWEIFRHPFILEMNNAFQNSTHKQSFATKKTDFERDPNTTIGVSPLIPKSSMKQSNMSVKQNTMTLGATQMPQFAKMFPQMQEEIVEEAKIEFVRIGDVVCIEFHEQIFDGLKEYAKIDEGKDNMQLAKIIEKPDFEYKGLVYSDGIVDEDIKLTTQETLNNQNKAIFKIEVVQEYKFTEKYNELKTEIANFEFGEFENPEDEKDKRSIFQDIKK
jgi:hypothetical protein